MTKSLFLLLLIALPAAAAPHTVEMKSISFDPKVLEIAVGDTVVWENKSYTDHGATAKDETSFDTGLVHPKGRSKAISFSQTGEFPYRCKIHGNTMSGVVRVVAPHTALAK